MYEIERTGKEIDDMIGRVIDQMEKHGGTKWSGMSYEQGVRAALDWVLGDDSPLED